MVPLARHGSPLKLNLGAGNKRVDGFLSVDHAAECNPDLVLDLDDVPWPFESDSVDHIILCHVLEHVGQTSNKFLQIMQELYRICTHDAMLDITVPHPFHDFFVSDPTHIRPITPLTLSLFDREQNLRWRTLGASNSPLALQFNVDFRVIKSEQRMSAETQNDMAELQARDPFLGKLFLKYARNVFVETYVQLQVRKR
jgi:hypothetical protein